MTEWTQKRIDTLTRLWKGGSSMVEIARQMDITRDQVSGKVSRLGLRRARVIDYTPHFSKPHEKQPPTPLKPQTATGDPIPFLDTGPMHCRWPLWSGPRTGKVCGATAIPGKPYCPHHYSVAFVPLWSRRKA